MKKYISIIVSTGTLLSGGAERVLSILSGPFASHYDKVIYLTWIDAPDFYPIDDRILRICVERECGSKNRIKQAIWFRNYVRHDRPTVVLSFLAPFNVLISFALLGIKTKLVVAERNDPRFVCNGFIQRNIRKFAYQMADGILEQTENNKLYFKGSLGRKTTVIPNPVLMPLDYVGKALSVDKKKLFVSVIRLTPQKNIELLLTAFKEFRKRHCGYSLAIYGEGPSRKAIEGRVRELGLSDSVFLPGAVKGVWDMIVGAEGFILPSLFEGMPNALMEAMCLGLPCISTKVSGAVDYIVDGENGLLISHNDSQAMAEAMDKIASDKQFADGLGRKASGLYERLRLETVKVQWLDYLDKINDYEQA